MDTLAVNAQHKLRLRALLLDSVADGVSVFDLESGLISYANPAAEQLFRCAPGSLIGRHFTATTAYDAGERTRITCEVLDRLRGGSEWTGVWLTRRDDDSRCHTSARISCLDVDGRRYAICVQEDDTRRRLGALDELLPMLSHVLDIREVFERVSEIAAKVLPHDGFSLLVLNDERTSIIVYADTDGTRHMPRVVPLPDFYRAQVEAGWDHILQDDMQLSPHDRDTPPGLAGFRARVAVPVRAIGEDRAAIDFMSRQVGIYTAGDIVVARRIADHVAMALSHYRLAEQSRSHEALRAHESRLELLDELLAVATDAGELKDQFDRISEMARKVLPHDALTLAAMMPDGIHARAHAYTGVGRVDTPDEIVVRVPDAILKGERDHDLIGDLATAEEEFDRKFALAGFKSVLRVSIRFGGRLAGGLSFVSRTADAYSAADVMVARRIAGQLALAVSREMRTEATVRADQAQERASALEARVKALSEELNAVTGYRWVIGQSPSWTHVLKQATQVAATDTTVLLLGESGTGKEVVARFLHRASPRSGAPFVALNCAALPEPLLESELFGYERGAFTGALLAKPGRLEQAAGGVLFLDEVGEMSPAVQAKFLRVLQEREFQRLGGTKTLKANVRVIAATNRNLRAAITAGTFREDLYYRLHVFEIRLPPLRDRRDDILALSEAFLKEIAASFGRPPAGLSREARDGLLRYAWPGNVRELRNVLERAAILCDGGLITSEHLTFLSDQPAAEKAIAVGASAAAPVSPAAPLASEADTTDLRVLERATIERALVDARHNKSQAAKMLGLSRKQLYVRLRQHGLE
jgi:transcriptional regulator with GAF, ATPase, and Fis domain